jgi:hypothetical protein
MTWRRGIRGHQRAHLYGGQRPACGGRLLITDTVPLRRDELTQHGRPSTGDVCALCLDKSAHVTA